MPDSEVQCVQPTPDTTATAPACAGGGGHESLRKFAEEYTFGTSTRPIDVSPIENIPVAVDDGAFSSCGPDFAALSLSTDKLIGNGEGKKKVRSALVFGENTPKMELPVRERIGRKLVKKAKEAINVDALCAMVNQLEVDKESENVSKTLAELRVRKRNARGRRGKMEKKEAEDVVDDTDVADELSFLVERCNLERESYQANGFMPYIT